MNEQQEIEQILRDYFDGLATRGETHDRILTLVAKYSPENVVTALPLEWRKSFVDWAEATFGNDLPPDEFIVIHQSPEPPTDTRVAITSIREWLSRQRRD